MNELNQFQTNDGRIGYSARVLHAYLGSERDFTSWFKYQVENCNLIEGKDYSEFSPKNGEYSGIKRGRGSPAKDFALTLTTVLTITERANKTGTAMTKALVTEVAERKELSILDLARELIARIDQNKALTVTILHLRKDANSLRK